MSIKSLADLKQLRGIQELTSERSPALAPSPVRAVPPRRAVRATEKEPLPTDIRQLWALNLRHLFEMVVALPADRLVQDAKAVPRTSEDGISGAGHVLHWFKMSHWYRANAKEFAGRTSQQLFGTSFMSIRVGAKGYRCALIAIISNCLEALGHQVEEVPEQGTWDAVAAVIEQEQAEKAEKEAIENYVPPHLRT